MFKNENPERNDSAEKSTKNFDWNNADDRLKIEEIWTCRNLDACPANEKGLKILSF